MSGVITLAADSTTLILNGTAITDLIEGDTVILAPVNPATSHVNAIGGGVNINERSDRGVYDVTVNVQRFSESDVFLNTLTRQSPPVVINGSAKENYNRDGTDGVESWVLENGSVTTQPTGTKNSTDGNAVSQYVIRFRNASRNI
jgi:hypothetical protein